MKRFPSPSLALILAAACLPLTTLAQQQEAIPREAEFEYVERWTSPIPPTEFPEPRADLQDEDVIVYHRLTRVENRLGVMEFYLFDKVTGSCLSKAETPMTEIMSVKGTTYYRGKAWIVYGLDQEIAAGTRLLVVDYKTGVQVQLHNLWATNLNAADVPPKLLPIGDYLFATSGYAMAAPSTVGRGSIGIGIRVYDAETAEHVGNLGLGDFRHNHRNFGEVMEWLEPVNGQSFMMGMYPVYVREDHVEFLDLTEEMLGRYSIGQPHVIYELGGDLYLAGWFYSPLHDSNGPLFERNIRLGRVYRWVPGSEPELLWDSMIETGVNHVGGPLGEGRFWMYDDDRVVHVFDASHFSAFQEERVRAIPQLRNSGSIFSGHLVLEDQYDNVFRPALLKYGASKTIIDLHDKITFDSENFDWIVEDHHVIGYSTLSTSEQTVITYGEIQVKPTSR